MMMKSVEIPAFVGVTECDNHLDLNDCKSQNFR